MSKKTGYQFCGGNDHATNPNRRDFLSVGAMGGLGLGLTLGDFLSLEAQAAGEDWKDVAKPSKPGKAKNIIQTCSRLCSQHSGRVPENREDLESLPGVGRKTANVILNTAFGHHVIAVDTHIFRVSNRTGLATGKNVREVEDGLMKKVPRKWKKDAHHLLILHGRYTCKSRKPDCGKCVIRRQCEYLVKTGDT